MYFPLSKNTYEAAITQKYLLAASGIATFFGPLGE